MVIGGSSGIGLAVARQAAKNGASVIIGARTLSNLQRAQQEIGNGVRAYPIDTTQDESVQTFLRQAGPVDHLVIAGSAIKEGVFRQLSVEDAQASMLSKFWGPYRVLKHANINPSGSVVLFSGIVSRKPAAGTAIVATINAAVEALGKALAVELAPVRVNVVSPGLVRDTGAYLALPETKREAMFEQVGRSLPVGHVGTPDDIAHAVLYLLTDAYATGTVIDVDGGGLVAG